MVFKKFALVAAAVFLSIIGKSFAQIGNPFASLGIEFYGFFLPWIFTFAIVYGLLAKLNLFGKNERISAALSFVIAFFVTAAGGPQMAAFFVSIFGGASMFLAGILVIILFTAILGYGGGDNKFKHTAALVVVIVIGALLFLASSTQFVSVAVIGPDMAGLIFWLIIIIVAIWFVTQKDKAEAAPSGGGKQT